MSPQEWSDTSMNLLRRLWRGGAHVKLTIFLLAVLGCYLVVLDRVTAQGVVEDQYTAPQPTPAEVILPVEICHHIGGDPANPYEVITIGSNELSAHLAHGDIRPVPPGGCPGPTEPTTPEPTTEEPTTTETATPLPTDTATATATDDGCPHPEPPTTEPPTAEGTTTEPTTPATATPSPTDTPEPTATVTASPPWTPTPTAIATKPGEIPDGTTEVTSPDGEVSNITLYDLDVGDAPPLPGGPGGITQSEILGLQAAAQTLVEGGNFHDAVAAAQPYLNSCDSRDAVRLAAFQLGIGLPDTGGPALGLIAASLLLGTGLLAWRLGVRGRW
jgi:hypothetical protein